MGFIKTDYLKKYSVYLNAYQNTLASSYNKYYRYFYYKKKKCKVCKVVPQYY